MVFKRRYRARKRRGYRSRRLNKRAVASIAKSVVNKQIEMKEIIYQYNSIGIGPISGSAVSFVSIGYDAASAITQLGRGITQGTANNQRIGNRVTVKGVYIDFYCSCASVTEQNILRFALISPKGQYTPTSTAALALQIFSNVTSGSTECMQPIDTDIFNVYFNKIKFMKPYGTYDANYINYYRVRKFIKFPRGKVLQWNQGNSQPSNDLFLVGISDSAIVSNPGVLSGFVKVYYKDA